MSGIGCAVVSHNILLAIWCDCGKTWYKDIKHDLKILIIGWFRILNVTFISLKDEADNHN